MSTQFIDAPAPEPNGQFVDAPAPSYPSPPQGQPGTFGYGLRPKPQTAAGQFVDSPAPRPAAAPVPAPTPPVSLLITKNAEGDFGLDRLARVISGIESSGGRNPVTSKAGAVGIMQIMPDTAREYGFDPARLGDPGYNVMVGMTVLRDLWKRSGYDPIKTAIAYNAGPGKMDTPLHALADETRDYARKTAQALGLPGTLPAPPQRAPAPLSLPPVAAPPARGTFVDTPTPANPMDSPGTEVGQPLSDAARPKAASAIASIGALTDIGFILSNAQMRDGGNDSILTLLQNPKSNVAQAMALYRRDPVAAADEYGAGSPKQNAWMAAHYPESGEGKYAAFMTLHPKTNAAVAALEEMFNPVAWAGGEGAGAAMRGLGRIGATTTEATRLTRVEPEVGAAEPPPETPRGEPPKRSSVIPHPDEDRGPKLVEYPKPKLVEQTVRTQTPGTLSRATESLASKAGLGSPLAEVEQRGGVVGRQWVEGLVNSVKHEDHEADQMMKRVFGKLTQPEQWEVVRISQGLQPDPQFFSKYVDLKKRADVLRSDVNHVTDEQIRARVLRDGSVADPGQVYDRTVYFPMSGTHDYGEQEELQSLLGGAGKYGGTGTTADKRRLYRDVDEWRASGTADADASAAEAYYAWRRQRMQRVQFNDAIDRAPPSLVRDIRPEDFETQNPAGIPDTRTAYNRVNDPDELQKAVARNNAIYPVGHPNRITLKDQADYLYARNAIKNDHSLPFQEKMVAPELWRFMQKNGTFQKYVDQGGTFLPGEAENPFQKFISIARASIVSNFLFHPAVNIAGNDAAARGAQMLGGPSFEVGGYAYNTLKAIAMQAGLRKPEQLVGGAKEYKDIMDRALAAGARAEFGVSRTTMLGGERARVMSERVVGNAPSAWGKRIDKAMTGFSDWNAERTFGSKGEGAFVVTFFRDASRKFERMGLSREEADARAGRLTRQALGDYQNFDPKSIWSIPFLFMPWLKGNDTFWIANLIKRPQYVTGPAKGIRDYNQQQGDPAYGDDQRYAPPDFRIFTGTDKDTGAPNYYAPPFVFRDVGKVANLARDAASGQAGEALYDADSMLEARLNPIGRLGANALYTLYAATQGGVNKGPETDYRAILNPKAPPEVQREQVIKYLIGNGLPLPLVGYIEQDALRRGWSGKDLSAALVTASGIGYTSESMSEDQRADVSHASKAFLKAYYASQQPGADPNDLRDAWTDYMDALKDAGVVN